MHKLFKKIYKFFYALPFSMKAGDILNTSTTNSSDGLSTIQEVNANRLSHDLIKGEVTQQVEELRYRTYKVAEEANNYTYIGDGVAVKKESIEINPNKIYFKQVNKLVCESVLEALNRVGDYGTERYTLGITYRDVPRFKIETYCNLFEVQYDGERCLIKLHFDNIPNIYNFSSKSFLNDLERIKSIEHSSGYAREDICQNVKDITFVTYHVEGERDLTKYVLHDLMFEKIDKTPIDYVLTYSTNICQRENLTDKFYSKEMDEKYKEKRKKNTDIQPFKINNERQRTCKRCGKPISVYDGDITESTIGEALCTECLEKYLLQRS